ncbi:MAG: ATP-binding protein [Spirochaetia bacterium]|jgi:signal transduction histidine kinase
MRDLRGFLCTRRRFLTLASLCVSLTALSAVFFVRLLLTPDTGLIRYDPEVVLGKGGLIFSPSAPFSAAVAGGLLPGRDAILSVNGMSVANSRDLVRATAGIRRFEPFPVVVRRDEGRLITLEVKPFFRPTRPDWIFLLVFCLALAVTAFSVSWRLSEESYTVPLAMSALLALLFACITPFSFDNVFTNALANAGNVASWLLVVFALFFPWKRGSRTLRIAIVALILVLYAAFCVVRTGLYARWMDSGLEGWLLQYRRVGLVVIISDGIAYAVLLALLGSAYARSRLPRDRKMLEWMLAGVLIALPPYFFLDQFPLLLGGQEHSIGLGSLAQLFLSIPPIFLLIALTRHAAFNLRFFLTRYGIYGVLFVMMIALFSVLYMPLKSYIEEAYRLDPPLPELFATGLIALAIALLRLPIDRLFSIRLRRSRPDEQGLTDVGLKLIIQQMAKENTRTLSAQRLSELRAILKGVVRALQEPAQCLASGAALNGTSVQQEAGARIMYFLRTLESLASSPATVRGGATAQAIARGAVEQVRMCFPGALFRIEGEGAMRLSCYPEEVVRALAAVLENAAEACEGRPAPVQIRIDANAARLLFEVTDDGLGIDAFMRRRIFQPFFTTKPGHQGLGLYFARIMVERNDGSVEVTRGDAGGTIARLCFPWEVGAGRGGGEQR